MSDIKLLALYGYVSRIWLSSVSEWTHTFIDLRNDRDGTPFYTNGKDVVQTEKDLKRLFPKKYWNELRTANYLLWKRILQGKRMLWRNNLANNDTSCYPNRKKPIKTNKA